MKNKQTWTVIKNIFQTKTDEMENFMQQLLSHHRSGDGQRDLIMCRKMLMRFLKEWSLVFVPDEPESDSKENENITLAVDVESEYFSQRGLLTWKCLVCFF